MHVQIRHGLWSISTTVSLLGNESNAQSILHAKVSLTAVNHIYMYVFHEVLNHMKCLINAGLLYYMGHNIKVICDLFFFQKKREKKRSCGLRHFSMY